MYLYIVVSAAGGEEARERMEIAGEYWLGVVPIDLYSSTPHFCFNPKFLLKFETVIK